MTITTVDIQLYEMLKQKLGSQQAEVLVVYVNAKLKDANEQNLKTLATKEDLKDLKIELKQDIADLKLELSVKMVETKTEMIRWVFAFFIPLMLAIIGLYVKK
jgi:tRNA(Ile)-lysidine synthase TilS/MesJ